MGHYIAEWINGIDSEAPFPAPHRHSSYPAGTLTTIGATARLMWEEFNAKSEI